MRFEKFLKKIIFCFIILHSPFSILHSPVHASDLKSWVWSGAVQYQKGKTDSLIFEKLAQIEPGSPADISQLPRAEAALLRLGYFSKNAEPRLFRIANRNRLVPVFDFTEANSNFAEASFAYDAENEEYNGLLMVQLFNILGTARDFSFSGENSNNYRSAEMFYKEPFIFGLNGSLKIHGEFYELDSAKQMNGDLQYVQKLNWEWQWGVGGGYKNDKIFSSVMLGYDSRDKLPLAFKGLFAEAEAQFSKSVAVNLTGEYYQPFSRNWTMLMAAQGHWNDSYIVGGRSDFIGILPRSIKTRSYGISELDFQWHGIKNSALHIFGQSGILRRNSWENNFTYGLGWEQGISNASIAIFYALLHGAEPMDGLLNMSVKVGF